MKNSHTYGNGEDKEYTSKKRERNGILELEYI